MLKLGQEAESTNNKNCTLDIRTQLDYNQVISYIAKCLICLDDANIWLSLGKSIVTIPFYKVMHIT